jgi:hypothetical protein
LSAVIQRIEADSIKRLQRTGHEGEQEVSVVLMLFHRVEPVAQPAARSRARRPRAGRRART